MNIQRHNQNSTPWSAPVNTRHRELWELGVSNSKIAKALNDEFGLLLTRNGVIGRGWRLKLPRRMMARPRRNAAEIKARRAEAERARYAKKRDADERIKARSGAPRIIDLQIPVEQRRDIFGLQKDECHWPVGNPGQPDFFFCGAPAMDGKSYCPSHCNRAFIPHVPRCR